MQNIRAFDLKGLFLCISYRDEYSMNYGYGRVSPRGKSETVDAQARQLTKAGCKKVFRDVHVSGAKTDRAQLRRVIEALEPGDVLMVTRLDRLARSTRDLLNTLAAITARGDNRPDSDIDIRVEFDPTAHVTVFITPD
jgi:DNA invertase Pin-like site-specific DNA recombinase